MPKPAAPPPNERAATGQRGELLAARWLERQGWQVVGRNVRRGRREADIVATRTTAEGLALLVAEVKTARASQGNQPASVLHPHDPADLTPRLHRDQRKRLWILAELLGNEYGAVVLQVALLAVLLGRDRETLLWHEVTLDDL